MLTRKKYKRVCRKNNWLNRLSDKGTLAEGEKYIIPRYEVACLEQGDARRTYNRLAGSKQLLRKCDIHMIELDVEFAKLQNAEALASIAKFLPTGAIPADMLPSLVA